MASVFQQFFGSATPIVNQTNAGSNSLVSQISSGGGGGGGSNPNPVVSTLTFSEGTNISGNITDGMIFISSILSILDLNCPTPQNNNYQFITNQLQSAFPAIVSQYQSTLNQFSLWGPSANQTDTGNLSISSDVLGRSLIYATNATGNLSSIAILADAINVPTGMNISSITVSSINGASPDIPKMNWGAVTIPASGSTIVSNLDNAYSGVYYQQLTYRGDIQASVSSLFASTISSNSFFIYGEPNQQVMYQTIGA